MKNIDEKNMTFEGQDFVMSLKRIEFLLEELIYQQILNRTQENDVSNEKFEIAMKNVSDRLLQFFEVPPKKQ